MKIVRSVDECSEFHGSSFVPTMGALHHGHMKLVESAHESDNRVVVSIYVNPTQFGPNEDFARYPRRVDADLELCKKAGVAAVFLPDDEIIYPPNFATVVSLPKLSNCLCGASRPGHFDGVATVVARLFGIVRPARAYFGWKDAQQFIIIRRMVDDLKLGVHLHGVETVREADGLACSSRNLNLSIDDRARAPALYRALCLGAELLSRGATVGDALVAARAAIDSAGMRPEYVDLRRLDDLSQVDPATPANPAGGRMCLFAAAARCGDVRLIDNLRVLA